MTFPSSVTSTSYPDRESRSINNATSCFSTQLNSYQAKLCVCWNTGQVGIEEALFTGLLQLTASISWSASF